MLIVAPRGRTKEEISFGTPSFLVHSMLSGKVPTEDALENAKVIAGDISLKNLKGDTPPSKDTERE